jgi:hypothetical protein
LHKLQRANRRTAIVANRVKIIALFCTLDDAVSADGWFAQVGRVCATATAHMTRLNETRRRAPVPAFDIAIITSFVYASTIPTNPMAHVPIKAGDSRTADEALFGLASGRAAITVHEIAVIASLSGKPTA